MTSLTGASRVDRSSRLPPHRVRVSSHGPSATVTAVALAANGRSSTAATWANTSLPRSVPTATTALAPAARATCARASPQASGA